MTAPRFLVSCLTVVSKAPQRALVASLCLQHLSLQIYLYTVTCLGERSAWGALRLGSYLQLSPQWDLCLTPAGRPLSAEAARGGLCSKEGWGVWEGGVLSKMSISLSWEQPATSYSLVEVTARGRHWEGLSTGSRYPPLIRVTNWIPDEGRGGEAVRGECLDPSKCLPSLKMEQEAVREPLGCEGGGC